MSLAGSTKYRGSVIYHRVFYELMTAAKYRGTVTYQEIAQLMGLPMQGSYLAKETGQILGEISKDEVNNKRPMLSAVAVGVSGVPGTGFFDLARDLSMFTGSTKEEELQFWKNECKAVYETWKLQLSY